MNALEKELEKSKADLVAEIYCLKADNSGLKDQLLDKRKYLVESVAQQFVWLFEDPRAKNHVEFTLAHEYGDLLVTIIKKDGKSPATMINELSAEVEALQKRISYIYASHEVIPKLKT